MSEQQLKKKCIKYLEGLGGYCVNVLSGYRSGIPDTLVCLHGQFIALEFKLGYNKPTPLQEYNLRRIKEAGGLAYIVKSLQQLQEIVKSISPVFNKIGESK